MNKLLAGVSVFMLVLAAGCESKPAGGPGATDTGSRKSFSTNPNTGDKSDKSETFKMRKLETTDLKQGETKDVHVGIHREKNFSQEVKLSFDAPKGFTVEPKETSIPADKDDVVVKVKAANDAPVGEAQVNVTAKPATGTSVTDHLKLKVEKMTK